jgi:hypothetical protein
MTSYLFYETLALGARLKSHTLESRGGGHGTAAAPYRLLGTAVAVRG